MLVLYNNGVVQRSSVFGFHGADWSLQMLSGCKCIMFIAQLYIKQSRKCAQNDIKVVRCRYFIP